MTLTLTAAAGCGRLPWGGSSGGEDSSRPVAAREAFDPRERVIAGEPRVIRLDDRLDEAVLSDGSPPAAAEGAVWDFDGSAEGWTLTTGGAPGVAHGRLSFRSGGRRPGIVSPPLDLPFRDLGGVEIRMRATAGERLRIWWTEAGAVAAAGEPGLLRSLARGARSWWAGENRFDAERSFTSEISADGELRRYTVRLPLPCGRDDARLDRLRIDPVDGRDAEIEIESIRMTGREGPYAGRRLGLAREKLHCESRDAIFQTAPSRLSWEVDVPAEARLEAGVALLQAPAPVGLRVLVEEEDRVEGLIETEIDDDEAWHDLDADLSRWGGRRVRLVLAARSERAGQVVLWSNPMIVSGRRETPTGAEPTFPRQRPTPPDTPPALRSTGEPRAAPPRRTNVLLYVIDSLRPDHLSGYGYASATSPHLDALAGEGALFERCSATAPWTLPSVASLLTSLAPPSHGATDYGLAVSDGVVTLQERFRQAGYLTAGFIASPHSGTSANLQQGYDWLREPPPPAGPAGIGPGSAALNEAVLPWLDRHADRPFYLFIHSVDPHAPYDPPAECASHFETEYDGPLDGSLEAATTFRRARSKSEIEHVMSLYDAEIRCNDEQIGLLIAHLRKLGILDETLLVVTSDHGEEFREHGAWEHGKNLNREAIDVPLLMRLPGRIPAGLRIGSRVSGLDVMPTILELSGLTGDGSASDPHRGRDMQGLSLVGLLRVAAEGGGGAEAAAGGPAARPVFSWRLGERGRDQVAVQRWPYKLILFGRGDTRLYDKSSDPGERMNLEYRLPEVVDELSTLGGSWLDALPRITTPPGSAGIVIAGPEND